MTNSQLTNNLSKPPNLSVREQFMLAGLMVQAVMGLVDLNMFNVAIPSIQKEFGLPIDVLALVVAIRFLSRLGLMPIYGAIGDRLGKKRTYMAGLTIFIVGSFMGFLTQSIYWLVFARLLQGIGGASMPLSMALITDAFPKERRGQALGIWNTAAPMGHMIGPVLGGLMIEAFGWRSIFILVAIGSALAITLVARLVPDAPPKTKTLAKFDWIGAISLLVTITSFLLSTTTSSLFPFGSTANVIFWIVTGVGLIGLSLNASRNPNPMVSFQDIKTRRLILPSLSVTLRNFAHNGVTFVLVLYLTNIYGKSPSAVGTILLFYSIALMVGVPLGGWFADRWISRKAGGFGLAIQASGMVWLGLVHSQTNYLLSLPGMILGGLGAGLCLTSFTKEAVASLGEKKVGLASGLYNMIRFSGAAASAPILGILLARGFERYGNVETVPQPYLSSFLVLAFVALAGILVAALIPPPVKVDDEIGSEL